MFSSRSGEWETPQGLFEELNKMFDFTLDVCATPENAKIPENYYTIEDDGLTQDWCGHRCWMNPPYGREIGGWVRKAYQESLKPDTTVVCLLPARTDTRWFHEYCTKGAIWFLKGRLRFSGYMHPAPFPSMIVIFPSEGVR